MTSQINHGSTTIKLLVKNIPDDIIRVPVPDPSNNTINIPSLWLDTTKHNKLTNTPPYLCKIDYLLSELNDSIINMFINSEKYKSADDEFKKSLKNVFNQIRESFMVKYMQPSI